MQGARQETRERVATLPAATPITKRTARGDEPARAEAPNRATNHEAAETPPRHWASLAPFVETPTAVGERMLTLAGTTAEDIVYDLGSGDGRLVIQAARDHGARAVGIEIDGGLVNRARAAAAAAGVADRTRFVTADIMHADVSGATVVTLYLLPSTNERLRPRLREQLTPGSRIVAHQFAMGDWAPDVVERFVDEAGVSRSLYLWRIGPGDEERDGTGTPQEDEAR